MEEKLVDKNFEELLEPYAERDEKGNAKRTTAGQIKWLEKRFPRDIIDKAILRVYHELGNGLSFEDDGPEMKAGRKLDHYLRDTAEAIQKEGKDAEVKELEKFLLTFKTSAVERYVAAQRGSVWKRIKAVFKPV